MWMRHLDQSPYCFSHYAVVFNSKGQSVCQCGWTSPDGSPHEHKSFKVAPAMTFAEMFSEDADDYIHLD